MQTRLNPETASLPHEALPAVLNDDAFWPYEPKTLEESGISDMALESIVLQTFLGIGTLTGRGMTDRVKLPFRIIEQLLAQLRVRQLIAHARPAPLNDFYYSLTEAGQKRALHYQSICSYTGPAPVPLMDYVLSVEAQASTFEPITRKQLVASFDNVTFEQAWLDFIGPAINSNSGIFLYGPPGNGKTTLAKCLAACRGEEIWIPHAIIEDGIIIKFFDAAYHQPIKHSVGHSGIVTDQEHDRRWIRVRRPTVVVGGELTMDHLEIRHDPRSNTCEAPLQMRSNCGCLLIDDFGRQRMEPAELLNRWIIPLENRHDYLSLPTGKKFCVPFEQIILFSTNLKPESLVDEAFLRRVPFKIHIGDPTAEEFIELFRRTCESFEVAWRPDVVEELILKYYKKSNRSLRRCHPRDLLHQIRCLCAYRGERMELRPEYLDIACKNYFGNQPLMNDSSHPSYQGGMVANNRLASKGSELDQSGSSQGPDVPKIASEGDSQGRDLYGDYPASQQQTVRQVRGRDESDHQHPNTSSPTASATSFNTRPMDPEGLVDTFQATEPRDFTQQIRPLQSPPTQPENTSAPITSSVTRSAPTLRSEPSTPPTITSPLTRSSIGQPQRTVFAKKSQPQTSLGSVRAKDSSITEDSHSAPLTQMPTIAAPIVPSSIPTQSPTLPTE